MNIEQLKQAIEIAKLLDGDCQKANVSYGRPVIVRSRDAGAIYGIYNGNDGSTVHLTNARQLWKWHAAKGGTLADVAEFGVTQSKCKFSVAKATVTIFNACAMIDVSATASKSIESAEGEAWK